MTRHNHIIEFQDTVTSTNDTILAAGAAGLPEGLTHIADTQTSGRGRGGHRWWSPPGAGLWMSTLLRPSTPRRRWVGLSLVAGAACRDSIRSLHIEEVEIKWPNDLYVHRRKLGGILCEARGGSDNSGYIALGIGINIDLTSPEVRATTPPEIREAAICMTEAGPKRQNRETVARSILEHFWLGYDRFLAGESPRDIVGSEIRGIGEHVFVELPDGSRLEGRIQGLGEDGELMILDDDGSGIVPILSGEVSYPR